MNNPTTSYHDRAAKTTTNSNTRPIAGFRDLPLDILYRIASKLSQKEFARTSILSSDWRRCMRLACPGLTFDAESICKCDREHLQRRHIWEFISEVNDVLQKHHEKEVVETLQVQIDFVDSILLSRHIDTWVDFVVSSRTKNLTLDLKPKRFWEYKHRYVFPFQLLDSESVSRLQHLQLSFVSFNPPPQFKGFPNLRKLHLQTVHLNRKDLERVLSHCSTLEWLCLDRCNLYDQLTVDSPLSRLLYLRVEWCELTKIKFNAANLATFEYDGSFIPIDLVHSFKLKSANLEFGSTVVFQHVLASLLNGLPGVQNLTMNVCSQRLKEQWLWDNPLKFTNLKHLQLVMLISPKEVDKVLYSLSFLRATPFIEKLEVHFAGWLWLAEVGPCRKDLGQCQYNYLKHIWITGFRAARGQLEFLLHIVENAPSLEVLLVEIRQYPYYDGISKPPKEKVKQIATNCLRSVLPQNVKFDVRE